VTVPCEVGARVPVNVHTIAPTAPADGLVVTEHPVKVAGTGAQAALTKVVKAGVVSLMSKVDKGPVLSLRYVIV
jgi:hypothetical protein